MDELYEEEEDKFTFQVGGGGKGWDLPFREVFEVLGTVFNVTGKAHKGSKRHCPEGWAAGGVTLVFIVLKAFSLKTKCQRVINYVFSFVLNSCSNWTWNVGNARVLHRWETKILRSTFTPTMQEGEELVAYKARIARMLRTRWKKLGLPS